MSEKKSSNIYLNSKLQPPKLQKFKKGTRIEFVNQNLQQAIQQIKESIKNKSKSNLFSTGTKQHSNPEKGTQNLSEQQKLFYTQTYKKKMEERLAQLQQRKKQLNARSLDKQMKARLLRKIQENAELKQKMELLKDIQQNRQLLILEKKQREKRKKEEQQLLHDSSRVNAEMSRKSKKKNIKLQLKDSRVVEQESLKDLIFKNYLTQKQKQQRHMLNMSRHQFLIRNRSSQGLRGEPLLTSRSQRFSTSSITRPIKTSHLQRNHNKKSEEQQEQQIIQQYKNGGESVISKNSGNKETKLQRKYNSAIRQGETASEASEKDGNKQTNICKWEAKWDGKWNLTQVRKQ